MKLPEQIGPDDFDVLHDDATAWRGWIDAIAAEHGATVAGQECEGTVLVARLGDDRMLKLYPPFLRDHFDFEAAMLDRLHGRLSLPTPRLLGRGERDGWPYLLMSRLAGEPLTDAWPRMSEVQRLDLLHALGSLTAEVHALPVGTIAQLAPRWPDFVAVQRERCPARQQRNGLPGRLLAQLPAFIAGELPAGDAVLLTGEYTPMNLFAQGGRLAAMFDFGDGLVGPRGYDWLGPLCFLAAGDAARCAAFMSGVGVRLDGELRSRLLRMLLLHRYSNPPRQIKCTGWQNAPDFETLAGRIWP